MDGTKEGVQKVKWTKKVKWKEGRRSNLRRWEVMMIPLRLVAPGGPADDGKRVYEMDVIIQAGSYIKGEGLGEGWCRIAPGWTLADLC